MNVPGSPINARVSGYILPGLMSGFGMTAIIIPLAIGSPVGSLAIGNPVMSLAIIILNAQPTMKPVLLAGLVQVILR